ncbi:MAG: sigma-70 family RNA polymerase sigma factor [Clostridia bacterium]
MRTDADANRAIELYSNTIRRICMIHLKNYSDTEDIFQEVFLKYILSPAIFDTAEYEKAWFIRVTINACKDLLKSAFRKKTVPLEIIKEQQDNLTSSDSEVLTAILSLDKKYKNVIYLYYYEGYTAVEIGKLLNKNVNTIYTLLNRGKNILKQSLGGDEYEE